MNEVKKWAGGYCVQLQYSFIVIVLSVFGEGIKSTKTKYDNLEHYEKTTGSTYLSQCNCLRELEGLHHHISYEVEV